MVTLSRAIVHAILVERGVVLGSRGVDEDINGFFLPGRFYDVVDGKRIRHDLLRGWTLRRGGGIATQQHLWFLTEAPRKIGEHSFGFPHARALPRVATKTELRKLLDTTPGCPCPTCWKPNEHDNPKDPRPRGQIWTWKNAGAGFGSWSKNEFGGGPDSLGYRDCPRCKGTGYINPPGEKS